MQHGTRIVYPSTCQSAQDDLLTQVEGTTNQVAECTTLPSSDKENWAAWSARVSLFLKEDPGWLGLGSRMDQIEAYAQELVVWQKLLSKNCTTIDSTAVDPFALTPQDEWWRSALQWGAVAVVAVAGAYVVGEIISVIPKPGPAPERERDRSPSLGDRIRAHLLPAR